MASEALELNLVGELIIDVVKARDLVDKEMLGTMTPFAKIMFVGGVDKAEETKPVHHGGTNPDFGNHRLLFNLTGGEKQLHVQILDKTLMGHKDIGEFKARLDELNFSGEPHWYKLMGMHTAGKEEGEVALSFQFNGTGLPEHQRKKGHGRGRACDE